MTTWPVKYLNSKVSIQQIYENLISQLSKSQANTEHVQEQSAEASYFSSHISSKSEQKASFVGKEKETPNSSSVFPSYISGVHHFGWDFCACDRFLFQPLR